MVSAEFIKAQNVYFFKNEVPHLKLKVKVKICANINAAWLNFDDEFGHHEMVAITVIGGLATLKAESDHENFLLM
jgi:hypothetical protein